MELSVLILARHEGHNLEELLPQLRSELDQLNVNWEVVVVDDGSTDGAGGTTREFGARLISQTRPGYGEGLRLGLSSARGQFITTLDADGRLPPKLLGELWHARNSADVIVGSRYMPGGSAGGPRIRRALSRLSNRIFPKILSIPLTDLSSGYRLYKRSALTPDKYRSAGVEILLEIVAHAYAAGYTISEWPLVYEPRGSGGSYRKLYRYGLAYLSAAFRIWKLRNSVDSADYDHRAYQSQIPLQRYWQRKRHALVTGFLGEPKGTILDVGCGTSRIIQSLPDAIAADRSMAKLRYLRRTNARRVLLSTFDLPFQDQSVDVMIHSQVIEHIPFEKRLFTEMNRVLKPGGRLIIGTPDYGRIWWPLTEFFYKLILPNAYADEHITHYTAASLTDHLRTAGFEVREHAYICGGELIFRCEKVHGPAD